MKNFLANLLQALGPQVRKSSYSECAHFVD